MVTAFAHRNIHRCGPVPKSTGLGQTTYGAFLRFSGPEPARGAPLILGILMAFAALIANLAFFDILFLAFRTGLLAGRFSEFSELSGFSQDFASLRFSP